MKALAIFFLFALSLTSLYSCKDDNEPRCPKKRTHRILQHAVDYFYFAEGSYWIYEEETTGEIDSIWVCSSRFEAKEASAALKRSCGCYGTKCIEEAAVSYCSQRENSKSLYGYRIGVSLKNENDGEIKEGSGVYFSASDRRIGYKDGKYIPEMFTGGTYSDLDSVVVNRKTYKEILHFTYPKPYGGDWLAEGWYARNLYLVKFRISYDSTTWNLVRCNIVK